MAKKIFTCLIFCLLGYGQLSAWGFFAHRRINRLAVFSLPPEMLGFFKENIQYITENAVNPDRRRYAVKGEAEKHYIDADAYGDSAIYQLPRYWKDAVDLYGEDSLRRYGIGPWNAYQVKLQLTEAFRIKNKKAILRLAADIGHYIGDINVPLHTTKNYNGQYTDQIGIHAFWESRIPELLSDDFDFFVGKAEYLTNTQQAAWKAVIQAHEALDSVLQFEKDLSAKFPKDKKYSYEERGNINTRVYSREFTQAYNQMLSGQVERQMRRSIKMTADFWYTAWIDAGQPDLSVLLKLPTPKDEVEKQDPDLRIREHEGSVSLPSPREQFIAAMWRMGG
ncbi:zinc dependent phospholipase C family protein [Anditalea andensis]|uniref:S1/P1 Nuclease n=1 Tax=Anditalea andensis TaxID=1048983 RepID=A0A074LKM8_9BACT|nr:zinc dependent phospholipase C family protein [Anditalea andensis]KEO74402.1 S1/P1 Nuclease [Anditalea andensis]